MIFDYTGNLRYENGTDLLRAIFVNQSVMLSVFSFFYFCFAFCKRLSCISVVFSRLDNEVSVCLCCYTELVHCLGKRVVGCVDVRLYRVGTGDYGRLAAIRSGNGYGDLNSLVSYVVYSGAGGVLCVSVVVESASTISSPSTNLTETSTSAEVRVIRYAALVPSSINLTSLTYPARVE